LIDVFQISRALRSASAVASDSIEITNQHPHTMRIALVTEKGETVLGDVDEGATKKLAITVPAGAKSIVVRAFSPETPGMEVSGSVPVEAGKPLKWVALVN